jgi:NAD-dependent deacetylase
MKRVRCLDCNSLFPIDYVEQMLKDGTEEPPCRKCYGTLKPDVVFFGEALPERAMQAATLHSSDCDLFIVVGSSLVVQPAALMPLFAKDGRARLVIINIGETPYDYEADVLIHGSAGNILERIVALVKEDMDGTQKGT